MLRAVLADLHLGQRAGDLDYLAATVDEVVRRGAGELVLLGDLCVALVGFEHFWDEVVHGCLEQLARARDAGVRVVLVEGNRDFFLDAPGLAAFLSAAGPAHSFEAGGRRFLLEHGDQINRRDMRYLFWRRLSKGGPARVWARLLPGGLARRIVHGTEARLRRTNFTYRVELPVAALEAAARRHFAAGVDVVLWGHFHRPWRFSAGSGEAFVLPAWLDCGAVLYVGDDGAPVVSLPDGKQFVDTAVSSWYQGSAGNTEAS